MKLIHIGTPPWQHLNLFRKKAIKSNIQPLLILLKVNKATVRFETAPDYNHM